MITPSRRRMTTMVTAPLALLLAVPAPASAATPKPAPPRPARSQPAPLEPAHVQPALPRGVRRACAPAVAPGQVACLALVRTGLHAGRAGRLSTTTAYDPADLRSAYNLAAASATKGAGETVAAVDAFDDPDAASDLAAYRQRWGLPACDPATGDGCVTKVDQGGHASPLPGVDPTGGWELEESVDLDMISAICPRCRILLVEAKSPATSALAAAENTAVRLGARFVTNSWGGLDAPGQPSYGSAFDHPGVAITVAAGDGGYGTSFPASSQLVTSVGGTTLTRAPHAKRGWRETIWSGSSGFGVAGTGSGCAANPVADAQPSWQQAYAKTHAACPSRVDNDVAAVADPSTPVWAYDSYPEFGTAPDWTGVGGTSVASPIIASVYALAGTPAAGSYPASYLYQAGHAADLNDVTEGSNGLCRPAILCTGERGYDGPTGWGTPDGTGAFASTQRGNMVTVADPGTRDYPVGATIDLPVQATDTGAGQALRYSATGLPHGVSISASTGVISGRLPDTGGTATVTLTATGTTGASDTITFEIVAVPSLSAAFHPAPGPIRVHTEYQGGVRCLQTPPGHAASGSATKVVIWPCDSRPGQQWTYEPDSQPDNDGALTLHGQCLDVGAAFAVQLDPCRGSPSQEWSLSVGAAWVYNVGTGRCLNDPRDSRAQGTQVTVAPCVSFEFRELFVLPAGSVTSGVAGLCVTDPGDSKVSGTPVRVLPCDGSAGQLWSTFSYDGGPVYPAGLALAALGTEAGNPVEAAKPSASTTGGWFPMPDGEIWSLETGLCLDDPHNGGSGTKLVTAFCSGQQGEIWAVS